MSRIEGPGARLQSGRLNAQTETVSESGAPVLVASALTPVPAKPRIGFGSGLPSAFTLRPASTPSFSPSVAKLSPNDLPVIPQNQGATNACGTTSLAMLLTYWSKPTDHFAIDKEIRQYDLPTAPDDIVSYANSRGMRASLKSDAGLEDIAKMIDQGVPVETLIDPLNPYDPNNSVIDHGDTVLHYVTVTGYDRDAKGKITDVDISDPAGVHYKVSADKFNEAWSDLKIDNVSTGLNRVMISMVPNDGRVIKGTDGISRKASDIDLPSNGLIGDFFAPSKPARTVIEGIEDVARGIKHGNLGDFLGGAVQAIGGGVATLIGRIPIPGFNYLGGAIGSVADGVGKVIQVVGNAVSDAAKAVGKAVSSAASAVGHAISSFFSGW